MLHWLKHHRSFLVTALISIGVCIYCYGCEAKTPSLVRPDLRVNRQELQLELDQLIGLAQLRMIDLEKQEAFKAVILQNAMILVQGQPFNPLGLLTGIASIYGISQAGCNITKVVKKTSDKRKGNNG
ncbi:hypothetical protein ES703_86593 [subsurface metagenome]